MKTLDVASTGTKAIVVETADYAKKTFDQNAATFEKLTGVKSLDQAIQLQSDYLKSAYEGFVAHRPRPVNSTPSWPRTVSRPSALSLCCRVRRCPDQVGRAREVKTGLFCRFRMPAAGGRSRAFGALQPH